MDKDIEKLINIIGSEKIKELLTNCINDFFFKSSTDIQIVMTAYLKFVSHLKIKMLSDARYQLHNKVYTVLDLASGVGNDLYKWSMLKFKKVVGIEINKDYVQEANRRLNEFKEDKRNTLDVKYFNGSMLDSKFISMNLNYRKTNLITCNFALNFFDPFQLNLFFKVVSDNLVPNGIFMGMAADGDNINYIFNYLCHKENKRFDAKMYTLIKLDSNKYQFKLNNARYFDNKFIEEYIITKKLLIKCARNNGLEPIKVFNFNDNPYIDKIPVDIRSILFIYFGFMFKKRKI